MMQGRIIQKDIYATYEAGAALNFGELVYLGREGKVFQLKDNKNPILGLVAKTTLEAEDEVISPGDSVTILIAGRMITGKESGAVISGQTKFLNGVVSNQPGALAVYGLQAYEEVDSTTCKIKVADAKGFL